MAARDSQHTIWGGLDAGFLIAGIHLKEEDSVPYWCGSYNSFSSLVTILRIMDPLGPPGELPSCGNAPLPPRPGGNVTRSLMHLHHLDPARSSALIQGERGLCLSGNGSSFCSILPVPAPTAGQTCPGLTRQKPRVSPRLCLWFCFSFSYTYIPAAMVCRP